MDHGLGGVASDTRADGGPLLHQHRPQLRDPSLRCLTPCWLPVVWWQVYGITLLIVASSPGGSYSNLWCSLFNADLALSVKGADTCGDTSPSQLAHATLPQRR